MANEIFTVLYPYLHLSANGERFDSADSLRDAVAFRKGLPSGIKATLGQGNTGLFRYNAIQNFISVILRCLHRNRSNLCHRLQNAHEGQIFDIHRDAVSNTIFDHKCKLAFRLCKSVSFCFTYFSGPMAALQVKL